MREEFETKNEETKNENEYKVQTEAELAEELGLTLDQYVFYKNDAASMGLDIYDYLSIRREARKRGLKMQEYIEMKTTAAALGMNLNDYVVTNRVLIEVRERLKNKLKISLCTGCFMADVCKKYGTPVNCLHTATRDAIAGVVDELTVENITRVQS